MIEVNSKELPKGWGCVNLGVVSDIIPGIGFPKALQGKLKGKYPFFKVGDISQNVKIGNRYLNFCENYIDDEELKKLRGKLLPQKSIVFAKVGEGLKLDRRAITQLPCLVDNNVVGVKSKENITTELFLFFFLNTVKLEGYSRATTVPSVRKSDLETIVVPLPPLKEQHRIVEKIEELFSDLDKGIESLKTTQQQLKIYRQAVLKWAFEGRLTTKWREEKKQQGELKSAEELLVQIKAEREKRDRTQLQEWNEAVKTWEANGKQGKKPGKPKNIECISPFTYSQIEALSILPDSWMWAKLGNLTMFSPRNGYSPKPVSYPTGVKSLSLSATTSGKFDRQYFKYIDEEIAADSYLWLKPGDILIQRGNTIEYVGIAAKYKGNFKEFIYPDLMMKIQFAESLNTDYFHLSSQAELNLKRSRV